MQDILLLPGLGCNESLFSHQTKTLENQFNAKIIICDQFDKMMNHVKFVLDNAPEKFVLIGHSFGGWIAQWIAIHAPERVSKLILIATATGKLTPELKNIFDDMLVNFANNKQIEFFDKLSPLTIYENNNTDLLNTIREMQIGFSQKGLINQVRTDLEGQETTSYLKNIQCETLLILGKQDNFYQDEMRILKDNIPNNLFIEIDECGHMVPLEKPESVSRLIIQWLTPNAGFQPANYLV